MRLSPVFVAFVIVVVVFVVLVLVVVEYPVQAVSHDSPPLLSFRFKMHMPVFQKAMLMG